MQLEFSPYILLLIAGALVSLLVAGYAWMRRATPSAFALVLLSLMIALWSIGYAIEIAATDLAAMIFWGKIQYLGITTIPLFWLIFAHNHANPGKRMPLAWMLIWSAIPLTTIVLVMTTEWHGLVWKGVEIAHSAGLTTLGVTARGWWFWVHFAYSYLLLTAGTYILVRSMWRMRGLYRSQMVVLVISLLAPWVGNVLYFLGVNPDPTPFAFSITVAGMLWAIFGFRLVDVAPLARDLIVEGMRDGMIALDMNARVADINPAAARMIGLPVSDIIGQPVADALAPWPHLLERFRDVAEGDDEIFVGQGEAVRRYLVRIAPLSDARGNPIGRLINLRERDQTAPPPRFAQYEPVTQPYPKDDSRASVLPVTPQAASNPVLAWLKNFFLPPALDESFMPANMNPSWAQIIERAVTISARFVMVFGSISAWNILSELNVQDRPGYAAAILVFLAGTYFLALVRTAPFNLRVGLFLLLVYVMALAEMLKYGFSADIFVYFMALVVLAHMLLNLRGGFGMLALVVVSMLLFAWAVLSGVFVPFEVADTTGIILPVDAASATNNILGYLFAALTMMTVVNLFIVNLNQSWKKETQALNLVQQERDLLEQRVRERTVDLAEARDLAVRSSNELRKYFQAIEQSGNSIVITNLQGEIEYVNPYFEQITGYTLEEALGQNPRILKAGTRPDEIYKEMWQTITSGQVWRGELQNKRKDGSLYWEAATIAPVQDSDGVTTSYIAVKEDITQQKELYEQLERQNQYLSVLQQTTVDLLNRQSLTELLNAVVERACALFDAPYAEIMLKEGEYMVVHAFTSNQPYLLGDKSDRSQAKISWQAHDTGKPVVIDDYSAWDGRREIYDSVSFHAIAEFPIMVGGNCIGVLALGRSQPYYPFSHAQVEIGVEFARMVALVLDNANLYESALKEIEQRKQAEEQNLRFLEDMKSLQEISLALSQVESLENLYIQMIDIAQRRLGLDRVALFLIDKAANELVGTFGINPDGMVRDERYYHEPISNNHWTFEIVNSYNHAKLWTDAPLFDDGKEIGRGWKAATALWNGFQPIGYLVCDTFLTRKPARPYETELISLLGNTFGHLIERKRAEQQLAVARDQALDASRFKSHLLAKVSHELRTPLGAIIGYAELLQNNFLGKITDEQMDAVTNIVSSGNYLTIIINELLDQAQIEAKAVTLELEHFSPRALLERVQTTMSILAKNKNLSFETSIATDLPKMLYGDAKRIQQILINLTGNAIKFTSVGGVKLDVFIIDAAHWALRVVDTGAGIPREAQEYIFEPFRQVNNEITNYNRGTGLGLSITYQFVQLMGGTIEVESEEGKGSVFTVTLPVILESKS